MIYEVWCINSYGLKEAFLYRSSLEGCGRFVEEHINAGSRRDRFIIIPSPTQWRP